MALRHPAPHQTMRLYFDKCLKPRYATLTAPLKLFFAPAEPTDPAACHPLPGWHTGF